MFTWAEETSLGLDSSVAEWRLAEFVVAFLETLQEKAMKSSIIRYYKF